LEAKRDYTDLEKFSALVVKLSKHGFRVVERGEMAGYQRSSGDLTPPEGRKPRPGQIALVYTHMNGTRVLCWTTFNMSSGTFINKGLVAAWVLILNKQGVARHTSRMIKRVDKFVDRILKECLINKTRVDKSAYCPSCGAPMMIAWRNEYIGGRYWICSSASSHRKKGEKPPTFPFNHGLTGDLLERVQERDVKRRKYSVKRLKMGKNPNHQRLSRKKWNKGVPA